MIFYKLLCIPPNLEILLTSIYTSWCLCSSEILSFYHLLDKINVCWSTNGLEENFTVIYLKYAVASVHILQFIIAYIMLAAEVMTLYPILFNKSAKLLNPIIISSTLRQIFLNSVAVILGAFLCYFSGSNFKEFQCFVGQFLINMIVSYYIIFSYRDFQEYVWRRSSSTHAERAGFQQVEIPIPAIKKQLMCETKSESSFLTNRNYRPEKPFVFYHNNNDPINRTDFSSKWQKNLPSQTYIEDNVDSRSSIPTSAFSNPKETFHINFINHKTKANLLSFVIDKKN